MRSRPPSIPEFSFRALWRSMPARFRDAFTLNQSAFYSLIFPWKCPGCDRQLPYPQSICDSCSVGLPRIGPPSCVRCGTPFPDNWRVSVCPECRGQKSALTKIRSMFRYEGLIREMIRNAKYIASPRSLSYFAEEMHRFVSTECKFGTRTLVAVPLHRSREWQRTYNQSEILAQGMRELSGFRIWDGLKRIRKSAPQSSLSGLARQRNVCGAFQVRKTGFVPRSVILVDDVVTTGATLEACAAALRSAGVRRVYAVTVARAVLHREHRVP